MLTIILIAIAGGVLTAIPGVITAIPIEIAGGVPTAIPGALDSMQ